MSIHDILPSLLPAIPVIIMGTIFLCLGLYLRNRKPKNVRWVRVLAVRNDGKRNEHGYLCSRLYTLTVEYDFNGFSGEVKTSVFAEFAILNAVKIYENMVSSDNFTIFVICCKADFHIVFS